MTPPEIETTAKAYCNVLAMQKGLDPAGYATSFTTLILIEAPLPWKKDMYLTAGTLPQEVCDLVQRRTRQYRETGVLPETRLLVIAPDAAYSRAGFRQVIIFERQPGAIARFQRTAYHLPDTITGSFVASLSDAREELPRYDSCRLPDSDKVRDLLVCTHGTVDAACARFGYPLYNDLRRKYAGDRLQVWRVSHFGGHVFAPTMMDMPTGHYWAYVEQEQTRQIVAQAGDVAALRGHYRGWAGLTGGFIQAAERELWLRYGWNWLTFHKSGEVLAQDSDRSHPRWADVRIVFATPDKTMHGVYEARVEVERTIETPTTTGQPHLYAYPQYGVTQLSPVNHPVELKS